MARFTLDASNLLGFDRDGNALWDVAEATPDPDGTGAHGVAKAAGMEKDDDYPFWDLRFPLGSLPIL